MTREPLPSRFRAKNRRPVTENKAVTPPEEDKAEAEEVIVHLGGPWFAVAGQKVNGRKNAEALAREKGLL
jgi:hypothetical protein